MHCMDESNSPQGAPTAALAYPPVVGGYSGVGYECNPMYDAYGTPMDNPGDGLVRAQSAATVAPIVSMVGRRSSIAAPAAAATDTLVWHAHPVNCISAYRFDDIPYPELEGVLSKEECSAAVQTLNTSLQADRSCTWLVVPTAFLCCVGIGLLIVAVVLYAVNNTNENDIQVTARRMHTLGIVSGGSGTAQAIVFVAGCILAGTAAVYFAAALPWRRIRVQRCLNVACGQLNRLYSSRGVHFKRGDADTEATAGRRICGVHVIFGRVPHIVLTYTRPVHGVPMQTLLHPSHTSPYVPLSVPADYVQPYPLADCAAQTPFEDQMPEYPEKPPREAAYLQQPQQHNNAFPAPPAAVLVPPFPSPAPQSPPGVNVANIGVKPPEILMGPTEYPDDPYFYSEATNDDEGRSAYTSQYPQQLAPRQQAPTSSTRGANQNIQQQPQQPQLQRPPVQAQGQAQGGGARGATGGGVTGVDHVVIGGFDWDSDYESDDSQVVDKSDYETVTVRENHA